MAEFLEGDDLNAALTEIFRSAKEQIIIISPFIKLHSRIRDTLKSKKSDPKLEIKIVFGKNESNLHKSLGKDEFEFLKDFPNIEIKYEPRLHAKYYANESSALLSSMNLYDFSQNNNIEFGIRTKVSFVGSIAGNLLGDTIDGKAFKYFSEVIENANTVYQTVPVFDDGFMGLAKKFTHFEIKTDELSEKSAGKIINSISKNTAPLTKELHIGYCIRTGEKIPFNPDRPLSDKAYASWSKYRDLDYKENFCHYSGEPSNKETTFAKPILKKNWINAKGLIKS